MNFAIAPLFAFVVVLLSVGAVGQLFASLFSKKEETESTTTISFSETATQLK